MCKRFVAIWFRHLKTDWMIRRQPELKDVPFVLVFLDHGRMRITEVSAVATAKGIRTGMVVADAKVILDRETHKSRGFGFVEMPDNTAAEKAMKELSNSELGGRRLTVKVAEERKKSSGSGYRSRDNKGGYNRDRNRY